MKLAGGLPLLKFTCIFVLFVYVCVNFQYYSHCTIVSFTSAAEQLSLLSEVVEAMTTEKTAFRIFQRLCSTGISKSTCSRSVCALTSAERWRKRDFDRLAVHGHFFEFESCRPRSKVVSGDFSIYTLPSGSDYKHTRVARFHVINSTSTFNPQYLQLQ